MSDPKNVLDVPPTYLCTTFRDMGRRKEGDPPAPVNKYHDGKAADWDTASITGVGNTDEIK
jgi:hypothetical protein